ncbi:MAG: right-handed parallel beta-helix repeat-containing protein [Sandaracinaceae bacterium]
MRRVLPIMLMALSLTACGTGDRVELRVDPPDVRQVARVGLRVWDTEMVLVADAWLEVGDADGQIALPWRVPLVASGQARWFLAEVELYDANLCPFARAVVSGGSGEPAPELVFEDTAMAGCAAAFVDPDGAPGACSEEAPCASLNDTLDAVTQDGRPEVVYLRGDVEHVDASDGGVLLNRGHGTGEPGAPFMLRAWPGTGTPRVRTARPEDGVVRLCCNDDAGQHVVIDGLDLAGGVRFGVEINGAQGRSNVIRHCLVHDNGLAMPGGPDDSPQERGRRDAAVIAFNGASDTLIEHNVLRDTGVRASGSPTLLPGVGLRISGTGVVRGNVISGNAEHGITMGGPAIDVRVEDNVVCRNEEIGIDADGDARIAHNSVVANGGDGIALGDTGSRTTNNLVVDNAGAGLSNPDQGTGDWLHGNGDGREDGEPRFLAVDMCVLTLRSDSPVRGARSGETPGAR